MKAYIYNKIKTIDLSQCIADSEIYLLLWMAGSRQSDRRPLGRERLWGLQGGNLWDWTKPSAFTFLLALQLVYRVTLSDPGADIETLLVCGQELAAGERSSDHAANQSYVDFADEEPTALIATNKQLSLIQILTHSCCWKTKPITTM